MAWKSDMDVESECTGGSYRGRMVWELTGRLSMEHAAEVWWSGGQSACS